MSGTVLRLKAWFARSRKIPRELRGAIRQETERAVYFDGTYVVCPDSRCFVCGRTLESKASRIMGIGPVCAEELGLPRIRGEVSEGDAWIIKRRIEHLRFSGWVPRSAIEEQRTERSLPVPRQQPRPTRP